MVMWSLVQDFFLSQKAEFRPLVSNGLVGVIQRYEREERFLLMCC